MGHDLSDENYEDEASVYNGVGRRTMCRTFKPQGHATLLPFKAYAQPYR